MGRSGCIKIALCLPRVVSRTSGQLQAPSALCRELAIERSKQKHGNQRSVGPGGDRVGLGVVCSIRDHLGNVTLEEGTDKARQESSLQARGLTRCPAALARQTLVHTYLCINEFPSSGCSISQQRK